MKHHVRAVYEDGVLRPLEPLALPENHVVDLTLSDGISVPPVRFVPQERYSAQADANVTLEEVRRSLAKIPGSLVQDFSDERGERP